MAYDKTNTPISDIDATYSYKNHRYVLTRDYIDTYHNRLGIPIATLVGSEARADFLLQEISRQVYRWMYKHLLNNSRPILEYLIAKDLDKRQSIIEAMAAQYDYALISSGNLVASQSGINTDVGTQLNPTDLAEMKVSQEVKETLDVTGMLNPRLSFTIPSDQTRGTDW